MLTAPPQAATAAAPSAVQDGLQAANDGATAVVDLAGTWNFVPQQPAAAPTTIQVPGGGWYKQGFTSTTEATYSRTIKVPASAQPQTVILALGAVNHEATVKIGNTTVGTSTTSYTPASFDLTPYVSAGNEYTLSISVKGRGALRAPSGKYAVAQGADWAEAVPQGIYRSATLRTYPATYIQNTFVKTSVTDKTVSYDTVVRNTSSKATKVNLASGFRSANDAKFDYPTAATKSVTIPAKSSVTVSTTAPWRAGEQSYWWPNVPYQEGYRAQLHLLSQRLIGTNVSQTVTTRFGFREFTQPANQQSYFLNGTAVNLRGDNIQGANYDRIDNGGKGDAFDTLPGFLPPSATNPGWPKAVDNYQRLNYNVVRLHQEIPSPYMIDVLDEMGLMAIGESAIRGSARAEDFIAGRDQMINHVRAVVERDRNHPSIVQWSQSNEADWEPTNSEDFQMALFRSMREADPTRPIIAELNAPHAAGPNPYPNMTPANGFTQFNLVGHYLDGFNNYGTAVREDPTRPIGEGEYVWPGGSLKQGFTWFSTSTVGKRGKGAADLRPYTLLSGWASFVPGTRTTDFITEEGRPPIYGEDNLPDPWSNPQLQLLQTAFSPYLTADLAYWDANGRSNGNGDFPAEATIPFISAGSKVDRTVTVFNDGLKGTALTVGWEARAGSVSGPVVASGTTDLNVPLGGKSTIPVSFVAPETGSSVYLVLRTTKDGKPVFTDEKQRFALAPAEQVDDRVVGSGERQFDYTGSWDSTRGDTALYAGTNTFSRTTGDTATFRFTGNEVALHSAKAPNHGIVAVSVDGGSETLVDLYAPTRIGDQEVFSSDTLASGAHTLTVRVTGTKNTASSDVYASIDRADAPLTVTGQITGVQSGRCLDLFGRNPADGAAIDIYDCDGGANQEWTLNSLTGQLINSQSGKCLDVAGAATENGSTVWQYSCNGQANQRWTYDSAQRLVSEASGKCLDVFGNNTGNRSRVVIWECGAGTNQKWAM